MGAEHTPEPRREFVRSRTEGGIGRRGPDDGLLQGDQRARDHDREYHHHRISQEPVGHDSALTDGTTTLGDLQMQCPLPRSAASRENRRYD